MTDNSAVESHVAALLAAAGGATTEGERWTEAPATDPGGIRWFAPGPGQQIVLEFPE